MGSWLRRLFRCRRGLHRIGVSVDHKSLTLIACKDCGKRFKFAELAS